MYRNQRWVTDDDTEGVHHLHIYWTDLNLTELIQMIQTLINMLFTPTVV
jgi:hypothetical protein